MDAAGHRDNAPANLALLGASDVPQPFGAYLFLGNEPGAAHARRLEQQVFLETFGNTPGLFEHEYGPYAAGSIFVMVIDHGRQLPAGVMRLIIPQLGRHGLKSLDDVEPTWEASPGALMAAANIAIDPASTWDIATLAVHEDYRSAAATGLVSLGLYQGVVRIARACGVASLVAILDHLVMRMTRVRFESPFTPFAEGRPYLGSLSSFPVVCDLEDWNRRLGAADPVVHRIIYEGTGIEPALAPLDVADAVRRITPMWRPRELGERAG